MKIGLSLFVLTGVIITPVSSVEAKLGEAKYSTNDPAKEEVTITTNDTEKDPVQLDLDGTKYEGYAVENEEGYVTYILEGNGSDMYSLKNGQKKLIYNDSGAWEIDVTLKDERKPEEVTAEVDKELPAIEDEPEEEAATKKDKEVADEDKQEKEIEADVKVSEEDKGKNISEEQDNKTSAEESNTDNEKEKDEQKNKEKVVKASEGDKTEKQERGKESDTNVEKQEDAKEEVVVDAKEAPEEQEAAVEDAEVAASSTGPSSVTWALLGVMTVGVAIFLIRKRKSNEQ